MGKVTKTFNVKITPDQERDFGKKAAELAHDLYIVHKELDEKKRETKAKAEKLELQIGKLNHALISGYTDALLEADVDYDSASKTVRYIINGEVIEEREMSEDERQLSFGELKNE